MVTIDSYDEVVEEGRQEFTANDFCIMCALDRLLMSTKAIKGDKVIAEDLAWELQRERSRS